MQNDTVSASGIDNQTPVICNHKGNKIRKPTIKTNVRQNDNKADTRPSDNAVNKADVYIFIPINKKPKENNLKPFNAIS